ncbi:DUF805 domain-containing protein [Citrobacter freundii]|uniref:DUF805 domain-containing protein n=1 Tax=Citrobacter freundii TaxID=546 RepID=UPI0015EACEB6|nr:DUF805 domain-containing protein [Citrobacter freundii]QLR72980.1 DUF805 domain-containing protein [Citrobacter freundii]
MSLTFSYCFKNSLKNITNFNGRTRRREYWYYRIGVLLFIMFPCIIGLLLTGIDKDIVQVITTIAFIPFTMAVTVRRLHDTNRSGWWYLLAFIPLVGDLVLFIFMCLKGTEGENRFGKDPKTEDERTLDVAGEQKLVKYCR